jgi:hypothetical protein
MDVLPIAQEVEDSNHGIYYAERFIIGYRMRNCFSFSRMLDF